MTNGRKIVGLFCGQFFCEAANLFGKDGTFMHCSGGAFFLWQRRLFRLRLRRLPEPHRFLFAVSMSLLSFPSASLPVSSVFLTKSEKSLASSPALSKLLAAFSEAVLLELRSRARCRSEPPAHCSAVFAGFGCGGRSHQRTRRHWQGQNGAFRFSVSVGRDFLVQNLAAGG